MREGGERVTVSGCWVGWVRQMASGAEGRQDREGGAVGKGRGRAGLWILDDLTGRFYWFSGRQSLVSKRKQLRGVESSHLITPEAKWGGMFTVCLCVCFGGERGRDVFGVRWVMHTHQADFRELTTMLTDSNNSQWHINWFHMWNQSQMSQKSAGVSWVAHAALIWAEDVNRDS